MKIILIVLTGFFFKSLTTGLFAQSGSYKPKPSIYAVVIGVSEYKDKTIPTLQYAEKDAINFYNLLLTPALGSVPKENISLITGADATHSKVVNEVVKIFRRANKEDLIIFYFSGHGKTGESENIGYLLGYDTESGDEPGTAINMEELKKKIDNSKAKLKLSYVDACHAGLFKKSGTKGDGDGNSQAVVFMESVRNANEGSAVFLASKPNQNSKEVAGFNGGVFTHFLIAGLKGEADKSRPGTSGFNDKLITVGEMETYLTSKISAYTNFEQQPFIEYSCEEEFPLSILDPKKNLNDFISKADGKKTEGTNDTKNVKNPQTQVSTASTPADEPMPEGECVKGPYCFGKYYFINQFKETLILYYTSRPATRLSLVLAPGEKVLTQRVYVSHYKNHQANPVEDETTFYFMTEDKGAPVKYGVLILPVRACTIKTLNISEKNLALSEKGIKK